LIFVASQDTRPKNFLNVFIFYKNNLLNTLCYPSKNTVFIIYTHMEILVLLLQNFSMSNSRKKKNKIFGPNFLGFRGGFKISGE
jgi:hypothetical protein